MVLTGFGNETMVDSKKLKPLLVTGETIIPGCLNCGANWIWLKLWCIETMVDSKKLKPLFVTGETIIPGCLNCGANWIWQRNYG